MQVFSTCKFNVTHHLQLGEHRCCMAPSPLFDFIHNMLNFVTYKCHTYNISSIQESQWPLLSFKYQTVHKAIVRHNRVQQQSTLNRYLITNIILCHLYTCDSILFNKVLISFEKKFERKDERETLIQYVVNKSEYKLQDGA